MEMAETMEAAPFWAEIVKQLNSLENLLATKPLQGTCCHMSHMCGCVHLQMCQRISQAGRYTPNTSKYISEMLNWLLPMINYVLYMAEHPFPADIFGRLHSPSR